jgi:glycosyltransferase involved in cell wall biosynthesis
LQGAHPTVNIAATLRIAAGWHRGQLVEPAAKTAEGSAEAAVAHGGAPAPDVRTSSPSGDEGRMLERRLRACRYRFRNRRNVTPHHFCALHEGSFMLPATRHFHTQSPGRKLLLCFSHLRWQFVYQRPQHLMSRAAAAQPVIFFEEPIFDDTGELPRLNVAAQPCGVTVIVPVLKGGTSEAEQAAAQRYLMERLLSEWSGASVTFWYYTPMALRFTAHLRPDICIYDCMDELSAFKHAPQALMELERQLLARADLVFMGGRSLFRAKHGRHPNCHLFPSSIEFAHFARARAAECVEPEAQARIPHPKIGFFGVIDERMDIELVARLAGMRPDLQLVFIGPVVKIDPAALPRQPNIHWLGFKPYGELPGYLRGWDAAFMPFALNESTQFISPTKTPEFLAAGVPVCSTPITDVVSPYGESGLVEIAADAAQFSAKLDFLLKRDGRDWLQRVDACLKDMSWDRPWSQMSVLSAAVRRVPGITTQDASVRVQEERTLLEGAAYV